ncbi:Serpentine Receptor, class T [Caenorhabditis elegans]|uniref:Serpentine Receptor, class T n=1 Tax=Caenorhabditis elegans TaxID=6239 RepID=O16471_CAEEL|nr:Serpentine Receptor, class T [Caenorhabditis elegans]CCD67808.2 Serpentine Receptor, class T [Caenorhabditis elegans]|eukprot:NP_503835.3 Serpentine Receptor, class T [Caenorhabditis elegans]
MYLSVWSKRLSHALSGRRLSMEREKCNKEGQSPTLYVICLIAIIKIEHMTKLPAYKTMLFLGFCDTCATFIHSFATGIFGLFGIAFCDYPLLIFILGSIGLGSWMGCCITSILLAFIRVCDVDSQSKLKKMFDGWRIYVLLAICGVYFFVATFLTKPVVFNPMSWFFDPNVGKDPSIYISTIHYFNNFSVIICTVLFYGYIAYVYLKESRSIASKQLSKSQISILLQSFFFCFFHVITAIAYIAMEFLSASDFLTLLGLLGWQWSSGSVCIVYLTLNKTIRQAVKKLLCSNVSNSVGLATL